MSPLSYNRLEVTSFYTNSLLYSGAVVTITVSSSLAAGNTAPIIPTTTPSTPSTALSAATMGPSTSTTMAPFADCPTANGSNYIATNKPSANSRDHRQFQISNTSLTYQILCGTDFNAYRHGETVVDVQVLYNSSSFKDCLNACVLYSFQTPHQESQEFGCTGATWKVKNICWLKRNVTSSSGIPSDSEISAMLLFV